MASRARRAFFLNELRSSTQAFDPQPYGSDHCCNGAATAATACHCTGKTLGEHPDSFVERSVGTMDVGGMKKHDAEDGCHGRRHRQPAAAIPLPQCLVPRSPRPLSLHCRSLGQTPVPGEGGRTFSRFVAPCSWAMNAFRDRNGQEA